MAQLFKPLGDCFSPEGVPTLACVGPILQNLVTMLLFMCFFGVLFMLIYGGIKYGMSGGDQKKVGEARSTITYAIIGVVLASLAFFILQMVSNLTGNTEIIKSDLKFNKPSFTPKAVDGGGGGSVGGGF